jgi:hypothetical protein
VTPYFRHLLDGGDEPDLYSTHRLINRLVDKDGG